ncbi:hypothetical protein F4803DRAFT_570907 [Xylaria telfairii]|nr:hypothetical protein F4803DRAFT_570907 [Xylaria telfairii]
MVSESHELHILKANAVLIQPTNEKPYHQISVTTGEAGCTITIAATKPFIVHAWNHPLHPDFQKLKPKPEEYVSVIHAENCKCASYSRQVDDCFDTWRHLHESLRRKIDDNASYAFYPEYDYETGEALAHASLVASLALGKSIPGCYHFLIRDFGVRDTASEQLQVDWTSDEEEWNTVWSEYD